MYLWINNDMSTSTLQNIYIITAMSNTTLHYQHRAAHIHPPAMLALYSNGFAIGFFPSKSAYINLACCTITGEKMSMRAVCRYAQSSHPGKKTDQPAIMDHYLQSHIHIRLSWMVSASASIHQLPFWMVSDSALPCSVLLWMLSSPCASWFPHIYVHWEACQVSR